MSHAAATIASSRSFARYAMSVQYHGGNFLGFSYQGRRGENCLVYNRGTFQTNLLGVESVEGRIRRALDHLVGVDNYTNIQVSSRTDRGVHAWRNTFQVDIRPRLPRKKDETLTVTNPPVKEWHPTNLVNGLNFYLSRLPSHLSTAPDTTDCKETVMNSNNKSSSDDTQIMQSSLTDRQRRLQSQENESRSLHKNALTLDNNIRILSSAAADTLVPNENFDQNLAEDDITNPKDLPWDVRFSATERTYAYRILRSYDASEAHSSVPHKPTNNGSSACYYSQPFEHDRVWRIHQLKKKPPDNNTAKGLDIDAMNYASQHLIGTHDFTSFRGKGCDRHSPIVTLDDIWIGQESYHGDGCGGVLSAVWRRKPSLHTHESLQLITVVVTGKAFLYHQVRNMVACLLDVGTGKLQPDDVKDILEKRDRSCAPGMAPAQGLFLVDVEHGGFQF